jgi:hypothetical protein
MISDTTIAATTSQNVQLRDKFRVNVWIAVPAALVTIAIYVFSIHQTETIQSKDFNLASVALCRGIFPRLQSFTRACGTYSRCSAASGVMGLITQPEFTVIQLNTAIYDGFVGMFEVALRCSWAVFRPLCKRRWSRLAYSTHLQPHPFI